ncbi:MAG TPA: NAD(P)/FAD-dependent oxidoreductase, partial [Planctomycetota bacterium]|nr:NAD(P)/FAD-dependent oxidoreductase [Planctomycetota bacterium]
VIGGGPAGSTAAYVLAKAGRKVVVLEREKFPRHHIGESLLPRTMGLYRRLDLLPILQGAGFTAKYGAHIVSNDGGAEIEFDFFTGNTDPDLVAWEVERETFDQILLDHARTRGAEVREETAVLEARPSVGEPGRLRLRDRQGRESEIEARWIIDASGQGSLLAKQFDLRVSHPSHSKIAVYGRYGGMARRDGRKAGNVDLVLGPGGWFWIIPLRNDQTSVGFVTSLTHWKQTGWSPEKLLEDAIERSPYVKKKMGAGGLSSEIWTASNYSYSCRKLYGPGFVLVGDAAEFLDPIWSTGVMLAMRTGEMAGTLLTRAFEKGLPLTEELFARYEETFRRWTRIHFKMIDAYYAPGFAEVLFNRRNTLGMSDAVTALLAGQSDLGMLDRFRIQLFYWLIKANNKWRFLKDPRPPEHAIPHG